MFFSRQIKRQELFYNSKLQVLLLPLSENQKKVAEDFLVEISYDDLAIIDSRLTRLSVNQFCKLVQEFPNPDNSLIDVLCNN